MKDYKEASLPLDIEHLADVSGGDWEFECELLDEYFTTASTGLQSLSKAVEEANSDEAHRLAHSLKGSSRSIGAWPMGDVCEQFDTAARAGDLSEAGPMLEAIRARFEELERFVRAKWNNKAA